MEIQIFSIPAFGGETINDDMNKFIRSHKTIEVEKQLVVHKDKSYWTFCIHYLPGKVYNSYSDKKGKPDFKEILDEKTFSKFSKMREIRKKLSEKDAVPAYAVFTNEELANIAKLEELDISNLKKIEGIGQKKLEKYGTDLIEQYKKYEKGRKPNT